MTPYSRHFFKRGPRDVLDFGWSTIRAKSNSSKRPTDHLANSELRGIDQPIRSRFHNDRLAKTLFLSHSSILKIEKTTIK